MKKRLYTLRIKKLKNLVKQSKEWAISQYGVKIDIPVFLNTKKEDSLLKNNQSGYMLSSSEDVPQKIVISKDFLEKNKNYLPQNNKNLKI